MIGWLIGALMLGIIIGAGFMCILTSGKTEDLYKENYLLKVKNDEAIKEDKETEEYIKMLKVSYPTYNKKV